MRPNVLQIFKYVYVEVFGGGAHTSDCVWMQHVAAVTTYFQHISCLLCCLWQAVMLSVNKAPAGCKHFHQNTPPLVFHTQSSREQCADSQQVHLYFDAIILRSKGWSVANNGQTDRKPRWGGGTSKEQRERHGQGEVRHAVIIPQEQHSKNSREEPAVAKWQGVKGHTWSGRIWVRGASVTQWVSPY